MKKTWTECEAAADFDALLDACLEDGPQIVTRRGVPEAVLVSSEMWRSLRQASEPTLKDLLLAPGARTESLTRPRVRQPSRTDYTDERLNQPVGSHRRHRE